MKRLILIVFFLLMGLASQAKPLNNDTNYVSDPTLQKYKGTWEFKDNKITFRIVLEISKIYLDTYHSYFDDIHGYHLYIQDNKTSQNSIGKQKTLRYGYYWSKDTSKNTLNFYLY